MKFTHKHDSIHLHENSKGFKHHSMHGEQTQLSHFPLSRRNEGTFDDQMTETVEDFCHPPTPHELVSFHH
jgi:hypothetical protein